MRSKPTASSTSRTCPLPLPPEDTLDFLRRELPSRLKLKNVSYHPEAGKVSGLEADAETTRA